MKYLPFDLLSQIIDFLTPNDVMIAMHVNKPWYEVCMQDCLWQRYCYQRWRINRLDTYLHITETRDYCELYYYLQRNRYLPQGQFTPKHQVVWGRSKLDGMDSWLTIGHLPDCCVRSRGRISSIELRLVIQNVSCRNLIIDFPNVKVFLKDGSMGIILGQASNDITNLDHGNRNSVFQDSLLAPKVIAVNGKSCQYNDKKSIKLKMFEFTVISIHVNSNGCRYEPEFLEKCRAVWMPVRRLGRCDAGHQCSCSLALNNYHHTGIQVAVVDESIVWKHYKQLGGSFMVLDTNSGDQSSLFSNTIHSARKYIGSQKHRCAIETGSIIEKRRRRQDTLPTY